MLERAENEGFEGQKRTKTPILCSGMVAASSAALPRALRGASGSSAPGNRLPQPTTQPAAVHAAGNCPVQPTAVCYRRHACRRGTCCQDLPAAHTTVQTAEELPQKATAVALPPWNYRKKLPPCATAGHTTVHTPGQPARRAYYRAYPRATYLPGILLRDESYRAMGLAPSGRVIRM